jgi:hypothetical protein
MKHVLVVGGTGMLRAASLGLAVRAEYVSVLARDEGRLAELADAATHLPGTLMPWSADYRNDADLATTVTSAVEAFGPVDAVVAWIHSDAPNAPVLVARIVGSAGRSFRWFDVVGSGGPDAATRADARREALLAATKLSFHRVVLGGAREGSGLRWLTHDEISRGVLDAFDAARPEALVGEIGDS